MVFEPDGGHLHGGIESFQSRLGQPSFRGLDSGQATAAMQRKYVP
jgi:hypothetical protein